MFGIQLMKTMKCFSLMWKVNTLPCKLFGLVICPLLMIVSAYYADLLKNSWADIFIYCAGSVWFVSYLSSFKMGMLTIVPLGGFKDYLEQSKIKIPKEYKKFFYTKANFLYSALLTLIFTSTFIIIKVSLYRHGIGMVSDLELSINYSILLILIYETSGFYSLFKGNGLPFTCFILISLFLGVMYKVTPFNLPLNYITALAFFIGGYTFLYLNSKIAYPDIHAT